MTMSSQHRRRAGRNSAPPALNLSETAAQRASPKDR